jgi:hypothetical protein
MVQLAVIEYLRIFRRVEKNNRHILLDSIWIVQFCNVGDRYSCMD